MRKRAARFELIVGTQLNCLLLHDRLGNNAANAFATRRGLLVLYSKRLITDCLVRSEVRPRDVFHQLSAFLISPLARG
jgi:hypothetical protein